MLYISTIPGKQKCQIPMNQILSMSNGTLLRVCTSLAPQFGHLLLWVEVRPVIPSRLCSKAFPPYLKAQQTQMQMQMPRVDRKQEISVLYSIQLMSTAQSSHLRIRFLITSITTSIIIIVHGLPPPVRQAVDSRSQQPAGYGLRIGPMHLRTTAT